MINQETKSYIQTSKLNLLKFFNIQSTRKEIRQLRKDNSSLKLLWKKQKNKSNQLEEENKNLRQENEKLRQNRQQLEKKISNLQNQNHKLQGMIFKSEHKTTKKTSIIFSNSEEKKKQLGAQNGHKPHNRKKPATVDQEKELYLSHCPNCDNELKQTNRIYTKTVEDVVVVKKTLITTYIIQKQYCKCCKQEVHAIVPGLINGSPFGINILMLILFLKYKLRMPINKIKENLKEQYGLEISEGGIQNILHNLKNKFKKKYNQLLKEIQNNRVKYGDETGWRINGQNAWCWLFATSKSVLYTIEETRGKGVPKEILKNSNPDSVLVRDDYPGYDKLPLKHQSCWAHLLRNSHEINSFTNSSSEAKELHSELKAMFLGLKEIIEKPFNLKEREKQYLIYLKRIQKIQKRNYVNTDVKKIQTRIINQGVNLITALKYEGAPLTNNYAERLIRPMVVTRKISGGSRSDAGAATNAVNMSIVHTLTLKGRSFFDEMRKLLVSSINYRYLLERGEY